MIMVPRRGLSLYNRILMSILSKGDFKTKQEWLKHQRRQLMKRESLKYHQFNNKHPQNHARKQPIENTLSHLLTSQTDSLSHQQYSSTKPLQPFKNDSDATLYKQMVQRLQTEEDQVSRQKQIIKDLERQIQQIKTENALIRGVQSAAEEVLPQKQDIQQENARLRLLYTQMQAYLRENGVTWTQNGLAGDLQVQKIKAQIKQSQRNYRTPGQLQFQVILQRIGELNEALMVQFGERKYKNCQGVFRLADVQQIGLAFYRDGVVIDHAFYLYSSKEGLRVLDDLKQGYYPYLLKTPYPDGAMMKVQCKLTQIFELNNRTEGELSSEKWFKGRGYSLVSDD